MVRVDECLRVGGWMDGRIVGCVTECVAWVDGWMDRWTHLSMGEWMGG